MARAQWVQTNGPYGAWVNTIDTLGSNIFIGTNGGVFESTDSGTSWRKRSDGLPNAYIYSIVSRSTEIFAGTYQDGIYRSTDSGASWDAASFGLPNAYTPEDLGSDSTSLFSTDGSEAYISSNGGDSWSLVDTNLTRVSKPQLVLTVDSAVYFAGGWITRTTDECRHWEVLAIPPTDSSWQWFSFVNLGDILFAVIWEESFFGSQEELLRSTDNGVSWENICPNSLSDQLSALTVLGNELFAGTYDGAVYCSLDTGQTWQPASSGLPTNAFVNVMASSGTELLAGFNGAGVFRSFDKGKTWTECNQGLTNTGVNAFTTSGDTIFAAGDNGMFSSLDNGVVWEANAGLAHEPILSLFLSGSDLYAGASEGYDRVPFLFSADRGGHWSPRDSGLAAYNICAITQIGTNILAAGSPLEQTGLYQSSNNGISWSAPSVFPSNDLAAYSFLKLDSAVLVATDRGPYRSSDDGNSWWRSMTAPSGLVKHLGAAGSRIFLSSPSKLNSTRDVVYTSTDQGASWELTVDTTAPPRGGISGFASIGSSLFMATDSCGIFLTTDNGANWRSENDGLSDSTILSLTIHGDELLAGTANSGVWRRPLAEMLPPSSVSNSLAKPDSISVYPDPAGNDVSIFAPGFSGSVHASLIAETGEVLCQKDIATTGTQMHLDLARVPNGTYMLELKSGSRSRTCRLVLAR